MRRVWVVGVMLCACAELPALRAGECGNGVVEEGEDCDLTVDPSLGPRLACGAPVGARRCRYLCGTADQSCPIGWGCADDGICRAPVGRYQEAPGSPVDMPSDLLGYGDVDGDRKPDLIGFDGVRFVARYAAGDGRFVASSEFIVDGATGRPAYHPLTSASFARVLGFVPAESGLLVLRGADERTLASLNYPSTEREPSGAERFIAMRVEGSPDGEYFAHVVDNRLALYSTRALGDLEAYVELPAGHTADGLVLSAAVGDLDGIQGWASFDELALAWVGDDRVYVYGVELQLGPRWQPYVRTVVPILQPGYVQRPGTYFGDVNGDGLPDLLLAFHPGPVGIQLDVTLVALATAPGVFASPAALPLLENARACGGAFPVAVGDLNGDGLADLVGTQGVCFNIDGENVIAALRSPNTRWEEAVIGDFNRDGTLDVAARSDSQRNLDFLFGDPQGRLLFNFARGVTDRYPVALRAGDFNGDAVSDVALFEAFDPGAPQNGALAVVFGATTSVDLRAVAMGDFFGMRTFEAAELAFETQEPDATTDVFIEAMGDSGAGAQTILLGGPGGRLLAPYPLRVSRDVHDVPRAIVLGYFVGDDENADALVLGTQVSGPVDERGQTTVWLLPGAGNGRWATPVRKDDIDPTFDPGTALLVAGKLAPASADVVVAVDHRADGCTGLGTHVMLVDFGAGPPAATYAVLDDLSCPTSLDLVDVDGDGDDDVVIAFAGLRLNVPPGETGPGGQVALFVNDGGTVALGAPSATIELDAGVVPFAVTMVNADSRPGNELAVLTNAGVLVTHVGDSVDPLADAIPLFLFGASRIVADDIDGDGLDDLIFNGNGQIHIYRAQIE